ncbi:hypothetical protein TNCV_452481 [Trichonephila clavipes]|nr:hypothetical protein TNCV_452481 [Trichonephila clavipes]
MVCAGFTLDGRKRLHVLSRLERGTVTALRHRNEVSEPYGHLFTDADGPDFILLVIGDNARCDESVRNLSINLLRRLSGEYKFAFISNQLQKEVWDI